MDEKKLDEKLDHERRCVAEMTLLKMSEEKRENEGKKKKKKKNIKENEKRDVLVLFFLLSFYPLFIFLFSFSYQAVQKNYSHSSSSCPFPLMFSSLSSLSYFSLLVLLFISYKAIQKRLKAALWELSFRDKPGLFDKVKKRKKKKKKKKKKNNYTTAKQDKEGKW